MFLLLHIAVVMLKVGSVILVRVLNRDSKHAYSNVSVDISSKEGIKVVIQIYDEKVVMKSAHATVNMYM